MLKLPELSIIVLRCRVAMRTQVKIADNAIGRVLMGSYVLYATITQALFGKQLHIAGDTNSIIIGLKHKYTSRKHVEGSH